MRNPRLAVAVLVLAATGRIHASERAVTSFLSSVIPNLPVQSAPCDRQFDGAGQYSVFVCAKLTSDFETFAQRLDQQVDAAAPVPESMTDWVTQVGGRIRWYGLGDKWLVVTYDSSSRSIVFSYAKDRPDVFGLGRDVTPPKRVALQDSTGDARRAARQGLKPDAGGVVIVNAVIKKDGTVGDAEILGCLPRRKGLEQAAMNALKSWRYEPATKEGTAVAIALTSAFNYGPNGTTRGSDGSDTSSGGSSGAGSGSPKGGGGF